MKRLLCTVLVAATFAFSAAQTHIERPSETVSVMQKVKKMASAPLRLDFNRAKMFDAQLAPGKGSVAAKKSSVAPVASIYTQFFGEIDTPSQPEKLMFQVNFNYGADAKIVLKLLDESVAVTKTITMALPETANNFGVLNDYFIDASGLRNFMVYVHHFVGGTTPDHQKHSVFVVNENGEIRATLDGSSAKMVETSTGKKIMVVDHDDDEMRITNYNTEDFAAEENLQLSDELFRFMSGSIVNFLDVQGVPSLVLAHYEKLFLDNDTWEVFPDNNMVISIYNFDLDLQKTITLDISTAYPEQPYTIPMAEFGMFYDYGKYDITQHTFNDDDGLEILYSIAYFDLIGDSEWNHYYVGDESGARIRTLEKEIVGTNALQEISGQDDQIALYIGDKSGIYSLQMFDVNQWNTAYEFPAVHDGQRLSVNFNRIPAGDKYHYLFGLPEIAVEDSGTYGKINEYNATGTLQKFHRLYLGADAVNFTPQLFTDALDPHLYDADAAREFSYATQHMKDGRGYNIFRVAKNENEILLEVQGDTEKGNLVGSRFIKNKSGKVEKLALMYTTGNYHNTMEFYNLPFAVLGTQDFAVKNSLLVYADKSGHTVRWNQVASQFAVYNMAGQIVRQGGKAQSVSSTGLSHGVYVLVITTADGKQVTKRFML